ncbi:NmrA family NAD(P)-binding protein [Nonomuraea sp. LPB2021202275-12-8]|uniref:NmrA family NAD(P)-binding protein n=1 Tax=Nonomuraea sp. LPB2021202275-12-8 TaxID=3120159 RepID=UPI00300D0167
MTTMDRPVLVIGATGRQGGAAVAHLLAAGRPVRALVRDPGAPAAKALAAAGAKLRIGNLDDPGSLARAATGAYGVFGVTPDDEDSDREVRRGLALADAAVAAGVSHLVFASVGGAERGTGIPYWESKWRIEQYIQKLGLPATILRPVRFMENHAIPGLPLGGIAGQELVHLFAPETPVQLIAVTDIGAFAALAFAHPDDYLGQAIEIAGDELTPLQAVELISRSIDREITYRQVAIDSAGWGEDAGRAFADGRGLWRADIAALRRRHPGMLDFSSWLQQGGSARIQELFTTRES